MLQNQEPHLGQLPPPNLRVQPHIRKHETETRRFLPAGAPFPFGGVAKRESGEEEKKLWRTEVMLENV